MTDILYTPLQAEIISGLNALKADIAPDSISDTNTAHAGAYNADDEIGTLNRMMAGGDDGRNAVIAHAHAGIDEAIARMSAQGPSYLPAKNLISAMRDSFNSEAARITGDAAVPPSSGMVEKALHAILPASISVRRNEQRRQDAAQKAAHCKNIADRLDRLQQKI